MSKNRRLFLLILQVIVWAALLALPYFMVPHQSEEQFIGDLLKRFGPPQPDLAINVFFSSIPFNCFLIIFFYAHYYIIFDKLVVRRRFGVYGATITALFIFIFFSSYLLKKEYYSFIHGYMHPLSFREIIRALTWYLLIFFMSLGLKFLEQWRQAEKRAQEIENEQLRTELSFLHAQINPHFLFNSLNTIYGLSLKKSDTAPLAVLKLSQLLRYVIDDANNEKVPLENEVNYLQNYIELQKLRSTSTLHVDFNLEGNIHSTYIAPLLLLPFVENAFKYGLSSHEISPISINLKCESKRLFFSITNKKFEQIEESSTGIGLSNVRRRLELLYPGNYDLQIGDSSGIYSVKLSITYS